MLLIQLVIHLGCHSLIRHILSLKGLQLPRFIVVVIVFLAVSTKNDQLQFSLVSVLSACLVLMKTLLCFSLAVSDLAL